MATGTMDTMTDTTSTGMPPIPANHGALDMPSQQLAGQQPGKFGEQAQKVRADAGAKVRGFADEGKMQVKQTLEGIVETVRDIATKLEGNGVGPLAKYAHQAADTVSGWAGMVDNKSVDDLLVDARTLVRKSPAVAVGIAVAAGFAVSRFLKATTPARGN